MTEAVYRALVDYVTRNDRVWPLPWHEFSELIGLNRPGFLPPLILGGAMESDAAKRERLLAQIAHIKDDPELLEKADAFLRSLPDEEWFKAPDPLSTKDRW
ncbi:hypothetical protein ACRDNQ_03805 [Palleronia sp. KMU-117]|uniref:hypothetical protein n=1 Tax=Palleronia sp. KMU-117 TaxID=3434108 RepID=UPI003D75FB9A